jgi:hypothetical protein
MRLLPCILRGGFIPTYPPVMAVPGDDHSLFVYISYQGANTELCSSAPRFPPILLSLLADLAYLTPPLPSTLAVVVPHLIRATAPQR